MGRHSGGGAGRTLLTAGQAQAWLGEDLPTLVVVGSGISLGPPCEAPSVWPFLETTVPLLFEAVYGVDERWNDDERVEREQLINDIVGTVLPEACYGVIGQTFGTSSHLDMWGVFGPETAERVGALPSPAHLLVADLAATRGWPIVTTNFDCFLEAAAEQLGYTVDRVVPRVMDGVHLRAKPGVVSILKVHGTAVDPRASAGGHAVLRIRSTAADLSRCARVLEHTDFFPEPRRALIIGYSGRDLDLFPWLTSRFADEPGSTLWIEPRFANSNFDWQEHRAAVLGSLVRPVTANEWAVENRTAGAPAPGADADRRDRYDGVARQAVRDAITPLVSSSRSEAAAALIGLLCSIGRHERAVALEDHLVEDSANWRARLFGLLWVSGAHCSLDRPDDAIAAARRAREVATKRRSAVGLARSWLAEAYAATVAQSLRVLPRTGRTRRSDALRAYAKVFVSTAAVAPIAAWAYIRTRELDDVDAHRHALICDYLEHWIRLGALLSHLRGRLPGSTALIDNMWTLIERACRSVGHTVGVLEVGRYRDRVPGALAGYDSALSRATLIGHPIGLAIAHRDRAKAEVDRGGPIGVVEDHLRRALEYADTAGSPSLKLKIKLAQLDSGIIDPLTTDEVEEQLDRAEGCTALHAQRLEVVHALTRSRRTEHL